MAENERLGSFWGLRMGRSSRKGRGGFENAGVRWPEIARTFFEMVVWNSVIYICGYVAVGRENAVHKP